MSRQIHNLYECMRTVRHAFYDKRQDWLREMLTMPGTDAQRILGRVEAHGIVGLSQDLMRMSSFDGEESGVARPAVGAAGRGTGAAQGDRTAAGGCGGKTLVLNGHMDIGPGFGLRS